MALRSSLYRNLDRRPQSPALWGDAAGMRALSDFLRKMLIVPRLITTVMVVTKSEIYVSHSQSAAVLRRKRMRDRYFSSRRKARKVRGHAQISDAQYKICFDGSDIARSRASHYPC